jgi:hypothetical protein
MCMDESMVQDTCKLGPTEDREGETERDRYQEYRVDPASEKQ